MFDTKQALGEQRSVMEQLLRDPSQSSFVISYFMSRGPMWEQLLRSPEVTPLGPAGKIGRPYLWSRDDQELILKKSPVKNPHANYSLMPAIALPQLPPGELSCFSPVDISQLSYLAMDEFLNETLIAYSLRLLIDQLRLPPLAVIHYQGAIYQESGQLIGVNIMEYCDLGTLAQLEQTPFFDSYQQQYYLPDGTVKNLFSPLFIFNLLVQVTCALDMLQRICGFVSGDLKAGNVFLSSQPLLATYRGLTLSAPFTCKIADYGKSSCTLASTERYLRLYHDRPWATLYLSAFPFLPSIENGVYQVNSLFPAEVGLYLRHMGIPYYRSFDYYTVLVSFISHPMVSPVFFATPYLIQIFWDSIWNEQEAAEVALELQRGIGNSINDSFAVLQGKQLRCQAIDLVMNQLQADPV